MTSEFAWVQGGPAPEGLDRIWADRSKIPG